MTASLRTVIRASENPRCIPAGRAANSPSRPKTAGGFTSIASAPPANRPPDDHGARIPDAFLARIFPSAGPADSRRAAQYRQRRHESGAVSLPSAADAKIRARFTFQSLEELPDALEAVFLATVEVENGTKPCCVAEWPMRNNL